MDKKQKARLEMLRKISKSKSSEMHEPVLGDSLKKKKLAKVTVISDDKEGLKKGLSKAQQILKAKLGEELGLEDEDDSEESAEHDEYDCEACEDEGCDECPDHDEE